MNPFPWHPAAPRPFGWPVAAPGKGLAAVLERRAGRGQRVVVLEAASGREARRPNVKRG
jgi:hypothetical protein